MNTERSVDEIRAELEAAMARDAAKLKEERDKVQPEFLFAICRTNDSWRSRGLFDPTVVLYDLHGILLNGAAFDRVGKVKPYKGAMTYAFNTLSNSIIMGVSGGTYYTSDPECFKEISRFLVANPNGGDITHIVNKYYGKGE